MVQGQECLPSVSETVENDITSRGPLNGMLKQRGYDRSGMLHTHVASSRCSSIWSQVQNDLKCQIGRHWISSRDISLNPHVALVRNVNRRRRDRSMLASMTVQVRLLSRPR
jgi:hypothetical protein